MTQKQIRGLFLTMVVNSSNSNVLAWNGLNFRLDSSDDDLFRIN
jgi:hypothetical protein